MEHWFHSAVLVTANFASSHSIADGLSQLFGAQFEAVASVPRDAMWRSDALLVIDGATFDETRTRQLATAICTQTPCALMIANVDEESLADLFPFAALKGLLPPPVTARLVLRAIGAIQRGELYFSRRLMSRHIEEQRAPRLEIAPHDGLTAREWRVLSLIVEGHSNAAIAKLLHLSPHTVKSHTQNIFRKISATNRTQAARWARSHAHALGTREEQHEAQRTVA